MRTSRLPIFCLIFIFLPAFSFSQTGLAAAWLEKTAELLSGPPDSYALLSVTAPVTALDVAAGEFTYHVFRRDRTGELSLIAKNPAPLLGCAFLRKPEAISFFNPEVTGWMKGDAAIFQKRTGFHFEEINPYYLSLLPPRIGTAFSVPGASGEEQIALELQPWEGLRGIAFLRLTLAVATGLPVSLAYCDERGEALRLVTYTSYYQFGKLFFPKELFIREQGNPALRLQFNGVNVNPLPDVVFTKAYVEEITR